MSHLRHLEQNADGQCRTAAPSCLYPDISRHIQSLSGSGVSPFDQPVSEIIGQIASMGFNGVRLPWSDQMWESNPVVSSAYLTANPQFQGEHAVTIFEQVVSDLAAAGLTSGPTGAAATSSS